jgi:hypothetical protein
LSHWAASPRRRRCCTAARPVRHGPTVAIALSTHRYAPSGRLTWYGSHHSSASQRNPGQHPRVVVLDHDPRNARGSLCSSGVLPPQTLADLVQQLAGAVSQLG